MHRLKSERLWLCWKYKKSKDGKSTKVPFSATGIPTGTSEKHKHTWVTFNDALAAIKKHRFHGIGLIIPKGYYFVDIDHRPLEDPLVQEVLNLLKGYGELSPSGEGIHILGKCDLSKLPLEEGRLSKEYYCKNPNNRMELYVGGLTNRYATFTAKSIQNLPLKDNTSEVITFLNKHMKRTLYNPNINFPTKNNFQNSKINRNSKIVTNKNGNKALSDEELLSIAMKAKNHMKFSLLYKYGDISAYESQSNADQALCSLLAFYTGDDEERIDRLFRSSKLYRPKWERRDYRESTIRKAIALCKGTFYTKEAALPPFIYIDEKSKRPMVSCPLLAKHIRETLNYIVVLDHAKNGVQRYIYEEGCYRLYSDDMFKGIIKGYITSYNEELLKMSQVEEVFKQIATDLTFIKSHDLNSDENIINFENGLLNLSTMTLEPHNKNVLSTIQLPCQWTDKATETPIFDSFMNKLTDGNKAIEDLFLEFMGVCLSNVKGWRLKKALFMVGPGNTGKSVLKSLTEKLLGRGNFIGIDLKEIEARFGTSNIYGKRLAGSSDMSFLSIDELKAFKKCTGGDSLFSEYKGENGFEFTYNGVLWFCMNRLPRFSGDDGQWLYDRIVQVECKNVIPLEEQNKGLIDALYKERQGILKKTIEGLRRIIAAGYRYTEPDCVLNARRRYMIENNTITCFFEECMKVRAEKKISDDLTTGKVYNAYKAWCNDNNHGYHKTAKEFREGLASHLNTTFSDLTVRRGGKGTYYRDITLTKETILQYNRAIGIDMLLISK
ncbi:MAG: phage/plasmid primase, P4 family [Clostridium sp.]|nr:phage/plasmid primase, P4 family [Clostridium sp.]MDU7084340.1 phage/plasmid primase, P4 family [Clostridium sp.]